MATSDNLVITIDAKDQTKDAFRSAYKGLDGLADKALQTQKAVQKTGTALAGMGKRAGMAGIQIQQFVGQVQGGVNPMTALSMQAADLGFVLGFPLAGAIAGITASFAGPLISAIMGTTNAIETQADAVRGLKLEYKKLGDAEREVLLIQKSRELGAAAEEYKNLQRRIDELNRAKTVEVALNNGVVVSTDEVIEQTQAEKEQVIALKAQQEGLNRTMDQTRQEMAALAGATSNMKGENDELTRSFETLDDQIKAINALYKQFETPQERLNRKFTEADEVLRKYAGSEELVARMKKAATDEFKKSLPVLKESEVRLAKTTEAAEYVGMTFEDIANNSVASMEDSFTGLIDGTKSVSEAFKDMASSVISDLIRMMVQQQITAPLMQMIGGYFPNPSAPMYASTAATATGSYIPLSFAGGGFTGNGSRSGGIDGQGGFPAILHPNETVIDHTKGQSTGGGVTINQTIQVTTGVQQTVRAEIMGMMPQIANASKAAVLDAKKRGGSYASAF